MGADKGAELWRTRDDFDFIAVTSGGSVILTEGLKDSFTLSEDISAEVSVILR